MSISPLWTSLGSLASKPNLGNILLTYMTMKWTPTNLSWQVFTLAYSTNVVFAFAWFRVFEDGLSCSPRVRWNLPGCRFSRFRLGCPVSRVWVLRAPYLSSQGVISLSSSGFRLVTFWDIRPKHLLLLLNSLEGRAFTYLSELRSRDRQTRLGFRVVGIPQLCSSQLKFLWHPQCESFSS